MLTVVFLALAARPVDRYPLQWSTNVPTLPQPGGGFGAPYVGNGDLGVLLMLPRHPTPMGMQRSMPTHPHPPQPATGEHVFATGKNDFWTSEGANYFNHNAGPTLSIALPDGTYEANITQDIGTATLTHTMIATDMSTKLEGTTIASESEPGQPNSSVVLTTVVCTRADGKNCELTLTLRDCCGNKQRYNESIGGTDSVLTFRKDNLQNAFNLAHMGPCDTDNVYYNIQRAFVVADGTGALTMTNGSCLWVLSPDQPGSSPVMTGECSKPEGQWALRNGSVVWTGGSSAEEGGSTWCLSGGFRGNPNVALHPCSPGAGAWVHNATTGFLQTGGACVHVVPDNTNNTLGAAVTVLDTATGAVVKAESPAKPVNAETVSFNVSLTSGHSYTIVTAVLTLRDIGCAGTRVDTSACPGRVEDTASERAASLGGSGALAAAHAAQQAFWESFWNASSIDITNGNGTSDATRLEEWYYAIQYSFGANVRQGKVTPSLSGVLVAMDPVPWNDQFTLDYNLESNFWGVGSSNRADFIQPYIASVTNPAMVETMRQRATSVGVWNGSPAERGRVGSVVGNTQCGGGSCFVERDLGHKGAYRGTAWVSTAFPLGDGRPCPTDLATRFIGGLLATPLIQYYEYTQDADALKSAVYPFVRDNAEFYASWALTNGTGPIVFPFTCAQEGCDCRDNMGWYWKWGPHSTIPLPNMTKETAGGTWDTRNGEHNAHADIAFASASFRKAIEYSTILGVDTDLRANWQSLLNRMPPYPTQTLTFIEDPTKSVVGADLSGKPLLTEALPGGTPEQAAKAKASGSAMVVWPWCNANYPIANFAAMWPTDEIGTMQTTDATLLENAKRTVFAINNFTGVTFKGSRTPFANLNGFGLSWPPATRVSNSSDAVWLVNRFATAANTVTASNGIDSNGGGMLENMGAAQAVNDLLMQSHAGAIRLFPVWDAKALGPASFSTLRAYGAFLVSGSIGADGTVSDVEVVSDKGKDCVVESPWPSGLTVTSGGKSVPVTSKGNGLYGFATTAGAKYTVSPFK